MILAENPVKVNLLSTSGRARHVHCVTWSETNQEIVVERRIGEKRAREFFPKPQWRIGTTFKNPKLKLRAEIQERMRAEEAIHPPTTEYHVPEDAPTIPVQKPSISHQEVLRDGRTVVRSPGDLTKELPGEYNAWAHRNDPVDEEALFKVQVSVESEFARQEAQRQYQMWKARRDGQTFRERPTGGGIGVGVLPPKR